MEVYRNLDNFKRLDSSVLTIGSYDGIHRGHFHIINKVKSIASSFSTKSVVITFNPHPRNIVNRQENNIKLLMSLDRKIELFEKLSIDMLVILDFSLNLMRMEAEDFLKTIIIDNLNPKCIVSGKNHTFGFKRSGNADFLKKFCKVNDISLKVVTSQKDGEMGISSTNIRNLIEGGFIRRANYELGSFYGFYANVVNGAGRGKKLKYPTANLVSIEKDQLFPKKGVYFTRCIINGLNHYGMCNFGVRPTFAENNLVLEVHLLDVLSNNLYGNCIWIEFLERIRDEKKFPSAKDLIKQLKKDEKNCLSLKYKYELGE